MRAIIKHFERENETEKEIIKMDNQIGAALSQALREKKQNRYMKTVEILENIYKNLETWKIPADTKVSRQLLNINKNYHRACFELGNCYLFGTGVLADYDKAAMYLKIGAETIVKAKYNLQLCQQKIKIEKKTCPLLNSPVLQDVKTDHSATSESDQLAEYSSENPVLISIRRKSENEVLSKSRSAGALADISNHNLQAPVKKGTGFFAKTCAPSETSTAFDPDDKCNKKGLGLHSESD